MRRKPDIPTLSAQCRNEDAHTAHTARLATRIFEAAYDDLGLKPYDGRLLEAAAHLHDIGFAENPQEHEKVSAEHILRDGLRGMSQQQAEYVAAIVALHRGAGACLIDSPWLKCVKNPRRALRLAALLRVADGLDHGHIQDAVIDNVRVKKKYLRIDMHSAWYAGNAESARRKADLWQAVMPRDIEIRERRPGRGKKGPFDGVIGPEDNVCGAARKLLFAQYRVITDNVGGAVRGGNPEYLHDIRVAVRRFRAALKLFGPHLSAAPSFAEINERLSDLSSRLGPIRDAQVWIDFLRSEALEKHLEQHSGWSEFLALQESRDRIFLDRLRDILQGDVFAETRRRAALFLRAELPMLEADEALPGIRGAVAKRMGSRFSNLLKKGGALDGDDSAALHALRKKTRQYRYWAECTAPAYGRTAADLAARLKQVTSTLGDAHDMDVHIDEQSRVPEARLTGIVPVMRALRVRHLQAFRKAWAALSEPGFVKQVGKLFKKYQPES